MQLITWVLLIIAVLVCVIVFVASILFTRNHERQIKIDVQRTSVAIQQSIYWYVNSIYGLSLELAENNDIVSMDGDIQRPILMRALERNPHLELLYIQGIGGMQTARSDDRPLGYRRHRAWFQKMLDKEKPFVYKSYFSIATRLPCASIYAPIKDSTGMTGIFGADISLAHLQDIIEMLSDNEEGRLSLVLDGDGVVIAHPDREYIANRTNMRKQVRFIPMRDEHGNTAIDGAGSVIEIETEYRLSNEYRAVINSLANGKSGETMMTDRGHTYYVSYAQIELPGESDNWAVITLQEREAAMGVISDFLLNVILVAFAAAAFAIMIIIFVIKKRVAKQVSNLTDAAQKIANGELNTAIPVTKGEDEIHTMTEALISMVEQLRIHALKQSEAQMVTLAKLQFEIFVKEAQTVPQVFKMAAGALRKQYNPMKIVMVYAVNKIAQYSLVYTRDGGENIAEEETYPHHDEIMELIKGKRLLYMNGYAIKSQGVKFANVNAQLVCVIPLLCKDALHGYIIIESADRGGVSLVKEEKFLLTFSESINDWIAANGGAPVVIAQTGGAASAGDTAAMTAITAQDKAKPDDDGPISAMREIADLDLDLALENMGGLEDLYLKSVRLFSQLLPENVEKMSKFLEDGEYKSFAVEVHGMKGSLNNIGSALGRTAERIEKAAKANEISYCKENYPPFQEQLLAFHKKIVDALGDADANKPHGDMQTLRDQIEIVRTAASGFDALTAKDTMQKITEFSYGADADSIINDIANALGKFDCEGAVQHIDKLKSII